MLRKAVLALAVVAVTLGVVSSTPNLRGTGRTQFLLTTRSLTSFGVDQVGELYATSLVGGVYQLVPRA